MNALLLGVAVTIGALATADAIVPTRTTTAMVSAGSGDRPPALVAQPAPTDLEATDDRDARLRCVDPMLAAGAVPLMAP